ncbi:MAG: alpha/beta hydrolase [Xanthomonadales bacterium]|jgi:pimeloyl-ACP methyl ester carboxylesterase|nr:alpha/beta hydrolase [Xanthomonadales bacterium]MDH3940858.1 alpha/beta hydrolase [Xanthomonadales bacterium]MDH4002278.1 alpha/beta hydrolase [Xanthomonadales bacterium]
MLQQAEVILVHGLWFGSWAMASLAKKLEASEFSCRRFSYATTRQGLDAHATALREFARQSTFQQVHFAAHSLGGLVTLRMLQLFADAVPGRVVLLGSPLGGSVTAHKAGKIPGADKLLGEISPALQGGFQRLPADRETGMIAGTRGVGLGMLVGGVGGTGDGTVATAETRVPGLADHIELPVTHTGMLYSAEVARQAAIFLRTGGFAHATPC